jgi:hypothetical protein
MYYENYLAHHTNKEGVWFCNGVPVSKEGLKKALKNATPEEREKINATIKKEKLKKELREHPGRLYKHRDELSKEEIDAIVKQIQWDKNIKEVSAAAHKKSIGDVKDLVNTIANVAGDSYRFYETVNKFLTAFDNQRKVGIAAEIRKDPKLAKNYKMMFTESEMKKILAGEGWSPSKSNGGGGGK